MQEILELAKNASPLLLGLAVLGYFLKLIIEKKIEGVESRIGDIARTSLDLKKELRTEERKDLVDFRVALVKWEDCLLGGLTDFSGRTPSQATANSFYEEERDLFLAVKVGAIRVSIYLRDEKLEQRLMGSISKIRGLYDPLINRILPQLIDLQAQLLPLEIKLNKYRESGMTDATFAPTTQDLEMNREIQNTMTALLKEFSESLLASYPPMAEELKAMKREINAYIYRSIESEKLDRA